jgi:hypothetical protein
MSIFFVEIWKLLGMSLPLDNGVCFLENTSCNSWHLTKSNIATLIRSFLQHVPIMPNNYCLWLLLFQLRFHHKIISHDLINIEYGLRILSLIWHLSPCSNVLLLTLDVTTVFNLFTWSHYIFILCPFPPLLFATFFFGFLHIV